MCLSRLIQRIRSWVLGKQELLANEQVAIEIYEEIPNSQTNTDEATLHIEDDIKHKDYFDTPKKSSHDDIQNTMDNSVDLVKVTDEEANEKIDPVEDDFSRQIQEKFEKNKKQMFTKPKVPKKKAESKINFEMNFAPKPDANNDGWDLDDDLEI